ncbi:uncharacterized protein LOC113390774 [Ctenocephalides felis]|uniref:uncharacterized protein LOC113367334 n=2 Tax=Ctenocephalides felis TaxID=7515 RepID=UPI000E6E2B3F|nr:uncharacterized protein LOC113367334 [Ctenocephalides felis]XP_026482670.1 uncharacterized protein LOC113390692 [Ctenocephalides felis]XP_026482679.1 uncharacterized protein LOC113390774 [Ctenocephalides felis]
MSSPANTEASQDLNRSLIDFDETQVRTPCASNSNQVNNDLKTEQIYNVGRHTITPFMEDAPDLWFLLIETEFLGDRIKSDHAKYTAVLRALDRSTLHLVSDVLRNPPTENKYNTLKSIILDRVSESRSKQVDKLLTNVVLGDKKPSQLLREMIDLARSEISEDIIHKLWLDRLPQHIRPLLLVSKNIGLQAIGEMADRLVDTCGLPSSVMATASRAPEPRSDRTQEILLAMMQKLNALTTEVENLKHSREHDERSRTRSHSRHRRGRSKTPSKSQLCFYHSRFGEKATKCIEPCLVKTLLKPEN